MQANKIIGWVGAAFFEGYLNQLPEAKLLHDPSVTVEPARFRLDQLTCDQIATIVREIVSRPMLGQHFDIKIPRALVDEGALPEEFLFNDNASSVRNLPTDKSVSLTASSKEHRDGTLIHITAVSAKELRSNSEAWVFNLPMANLNRLELFGCSRCIRSQRICHQGKSADPHKTNLTTASYSSRDYG